MTLVRSGLAALPILLALSARAEADQFLIGNECNEAATRDAAQQVRAFLESALKD